MAKATKPVVSPKAAAQKTPSALLKEAAQFEKDSLEALTLYGKDRKKTALEAKEKAKDAFLTFSLSAFPPAIQASPVYVASGTSPSEKQNKVFTDKLRRIPAEDASAKRKLRLRFSEAQVRAMGLTIGTDGRVRGEAPLKSVVAQLRDATGGGAALTFLRDRLTSCSLEQEAENRMAEAESCAASPTSPETPTPEGPSVSAPNEGPAPGISTEALLNEQLARQMAHVTAPEVALKYGYERDGKITAVLKPGAADVTSFHDFHELKIAFESLWSEVFDKTLVDLGRRLFEDIVKREDWSLPGFDPGSRLETVDDMKALLASYRNSRASRSSAQVPAGLYRIVRSGELDRVWPRLKPEQQAALMGFMQEYDMHSAFANFTGTGETRRTEISATATAVFNAMATSSQFSEDHLDKIMAEIDRRLSEKYRFDVFAPDSINYGLLLSYRQAWEPQNYQVGDLVSTVPLAPKEIRRYTTKHVTHKSRAQKELQDTQVSSTSSSASTSRAEGEIVKRARNATSFTQTAEATLSVGVFEGRFGTTFGIESERESSDTKRNFREAVLNAAQEFRQQHKVEVEVSSSEETESTTFGEITNPNDEITVTYLFYELERQYKVSERIHRLTPVIMVANAVPAPHEIDEAWLMAHSWILRRVILDEGFIPAIDYLTTGLTGDELAVEVLRENMQRQADLVDELTKQSMQKSNIAAESFLQLKNLMTRPSAEISELQLVALGFMMGPLGLLLGGGGDDGLQQKREEMAKMSLERSDKDAQQFSAKLTQEMSALKESVDRYVKELQAHFDRKTAVARLRMHVKDNILFYMQAIWDYEPTDQRLFRLYNTEVDWFDFQESTSTRITVEGGRPLNPWMESILPGGPTFELEVTIPLDPFVRVKKRLSDVADLDRLLGYKGNYMLFSVKEPSYLHWYMMQDYVDPATGGLRDPDEFANMTTDQLVKAICCLKKRDPALFAAERPNLMKMIQARMASHRPESDLVVVPSGSLYIEALPGKYPILEDFKMVHRAIDVKKVQSEVRHAELENLRLAARLLEGEREDPDIDRKIVVEGATPLINPSES